MRDLIKRLGKTFKKAIVSTSAGYFLQLLLLIAWQLMVKKSFEEKIEK